VIGVHNNVAFYNIEGLQTETDCDSADSAIDHVFSEGMALFFIHIRLNNLYSIINVFE